MNYCVILYNHRTYQIKLIFYFYYLKDITIIKATENEL